MARSPEAARIGALIADIMYEKRITRDELGERIGLLKGEVPNRMWVARRVNGEIHLTNLEVIGREGDKLYARYAPNDELKLIAEALGVDADKLAEAALAPLTEAQQATPVTV
jgi:transcriptional regulator with XRE-family HTH domain